MLSPECTRFREEFVAGESAEHRLACADCHAFAQALERAARARLERPLPAALAGRLRAIAEPSLDRELALPLSLPLPQRPLPADLKARLCAIGRSRAARRPPFWVLDPRWAVAASYFLVVLLGVAFGNPAEIARRGEAKAAGIVAAVSRGVEEARQVMPPALGGGKTASPSTVQPNIRRRPGA